MFRYRKIDNKLTGWKTRVEESQTYDFSLSLSLSLSHTHTSLLHVTDPVSISVAVIRRQKLP